MVCPPVRGDNIRAFASELSYVQVDSQVDYLTYRWTAKRVILRTGGGGGSQVDYLTYSGQLWYNYFISPTPV